jgi:Transposase DDE domain
MFDFEETPPMESQIGCARTAIPSLDASGRIQRIWGGYSPKVYDGARVQTHKEELARDFRGAHVIADTHYETANATMKQIRMEKEVIFYHPIAAPRGRPPKGSVGLHVLTKAQTDWSDRLSATRARVESPFGQIKLKWKALNLFREGETQQNFLVHIAFGSLNFGQ